jgi:hypothetical protein
MKGLSRRAKTLLSQIKAQFYPFTLKVNKVLNLSYEVV